MMKKNTLLLLAAMIALGGTARGQQTMDKTGILLVPGWEQVYEAYTPDAAAIAALKEKTPGLRADVYFATWCDDSKKNVPQFLKILDALNDADFKVTFHALDKKATTGQKYYVEDVRVEKVPTFIFYLNDAEIGRIIENPKYSILQDMLQIVL
jgi:hypothetical protein